MEINLKEIRLKSHEFARNARAISRMVTTDEFGVLWDTMSKDDRTIILTIIEANDREKFTIFITKKESPDIGEMTIRCLRRIGQRLGIRHYNRLPKANLLSEISNAASRTGKSLAEIAQRDAP